MIFNILTIFPDMFPGPLGYSNIGTALKNKLWTLNVIDIRAFALDKHLSVDDRPYGGGPGMIMKADVLGRCVDNILSVHPTTKLIFPSPRGRKFDQDIARQIIEFDNITLLCGRFEGIDERVVDFYKFQEISVGDYILSGGELGSMVIVDACLRMLPGVLGNAASLEDESFSSGGLEYPQYTRPAKWKDLGVPEVLLRGNHKEIAVWRRMSSRALTTSRRPDLLADDND
ncbi:tRNA (guanosine(37)-N1)-methyltransferase TrmD [Anaplasma bovis]|uniref:tRNA (guanosine(37)-N1)-methyltransferase TrmD n=1 Tax=Anaplasma bovis TaxID=186733 RepID=UPI002FF0372A